MAVGGAAGNTDWRKELLALEMKWIGSAQSKIQDEISAYSKKADESSGTAPKGGTPGTIGDDSKGTSGMNQKDSLQLQYDMGNYTSIVQATTNIEKSLKDTLQATVRNFN